MMAWSRNRRVIGKGLILILFAIAAGCAISRLNWSMVGRHLATAAVVPLVLMCAAWIAALFVRPLRLMILIGAMASDIQRRYWPVWCADILAMAMNSFIPLRAGDMAMALVLRQHIGLRTARGFSAMLVDRFFDLLTVVALFVAALSVAPSVTPWAATLTFSMPITFGAITLSVLLMIRVRFLWLGLLDRLLASLAPGHKKIWGDRIHDLLDGLIVVSRPGVLAPVLCLSIVQWAFVTVSYWCGALSVVPDLPIAAGAITAAAVALSVVVPAPPAGVGVFHAVAVVALSLFGVPAESALATAIICHALQLGIVLLFAIVALLTQNVSLRSLVHASEVHRD